MGRLLSPILFLCSILILFLTLQSIEYASVRLPDTYKSLKETYEKFKEVMSTEEKDKLPKVSEDDQYKKAEEPLFQKSQIKNKYTEIFWIIWPVLLLMAVAITMVKIHWVRGKATVLFAILINLWSIPPRRLSAPFCIVAILFVVLGKPNFLIPYLNMPPFWCTSNKWLMSLFIIAAVFTFWVIRSIREKLSSEINAPTPLSKILKNLASRHLSNCLLTFITASYLPNIIPIILGSSGQFWLAYALDTTTETDPYLYYTFFLYSLILMMYWAPPLIRGLYSFDDLYQKAFYNKLVRHLHSDRLVEHYIVVGYGRFGKTVTYDLLKNHLNRDNIYSEGKNLTIYGERESEKRRKIKEPHLDFERWLSNSCEQILYCSNMVIIDTDERLFDICFENPAIGKVGVAIINLTDLEKEGFRDNQKIKEDYEKVFIPAIIGDINNKTVIDLSGLKKSRMVLSLTPGLPLPQQLFNIVAEKPKKAFIAISDTNEEFYLTPKSYNTNIAFLHGFRIRGNEIGNVLCWNYRKLLQATESSPKILILGSGKQLHFILEKLRLGLMKQKDFFKNNTLIIGIDEYIKKSLTYDSETPEKPKELLEEIQFPDSIKDKISYWNYQTSHGGSVHSFLVPYLEGHPYNPSLIDPLLLHSSQTSNSYQIVVVSSNDPKEIVKTMHDVNRILACKPKNGKFPIIICESNRVIRDNIIDAMSYYAYLSKNPALFLKNPYPVKFSENMIDSFEQACTEVRGYIDAMSRDGAAILKVCVQDQAGSLESLCYRLAALSESKDPSPCKNSPQQIPSFHNSRCTSYGDFFCFFSEAELAESNIASRDSNNIHSVFVASECLTTRELIAGGSGSSLIPPLSSKWNCPHLTWCDNCAMRHAINSETSEANKKSLESALKEGSAKFVKIEDLQKHPAREISAKIYACCYGYASTGAFAMVLRKLLLKKVDQIKRENKDKVFDMKFMMSVDCHNPQCEYLCIYGNLIPLSHKETKQDLSKMFSECLKGVIIDPVKCHKGAWLTYSKQLKDNALNESYSPYTTTNTNDILLIEDSYKDALLWEGFSEYTTHTIDLMHRQGKKPNNINTTLQTALLQGEYSMLSAGDFISECNSLNECNDIEEYRERIYGFIDKKRKNTLLCPVPISRCSFKSKSLYLLKHGAVST